MMSMHYAKFIMTMFISKRQLCFGFLERLLLLK